MSEILTKYDYIAIALSDIMSDGMLVEVLNRNGCCNWTVCPECRVDDFTHVGGCSISKEISQELLSKFG